MTGTGPPLRPIPPGAGRLVVDCSYSRLMWNLRFAHPVITVNGRAIKVHWGRVPLDLPPGWHHLGVGYHYGLRVGTAWTRVPVRVGAETVLYYRAPMYWFIPGALGPVPQPAPGRTVALIATVAALVLVLMTPALVLLVS